MCICFFFYQCGSVSLTNVKNDFGKVWDGWIDAQEREKTVSHGKTRWHHGLVWPSTKSIIYFTEIPKACADTILYKQKDSQGEN